MAVVYSRTPAATFSTCYMIHVTIVTEDGSGNHGKQVINVTGHNTGNYGNMTRCR